MLLAAFETLEVRKRLVEGGPRFRVLRDTGFIEIGKVIS